MVIPQEQWEGDIRTSELAKGNLFLPSSRIPQRLRAEPPGALQGPDFFDASTDNMHVEINGIHL